MRNLVAGALYYVVLKHLPASTAPLGKIWKYLRYIAARELLDYCGHDVNIERGAYFGRGHGVRIGSHSGVGINARLHGPVTIGDDVMMGPDVVILAMQHGTRDLNAPMRVQANAPNRTVTIGDDVWIGTRAVILPGRHVGSHSIIGAGAVVTTDVDPWKVVGGNPAQVLKDRRDLS